MLKTKRNSSDEDDIPLMELAERMQEKDRAEDQKSLNQVSSFDEHTKDSKFKTLMQAIVGML